MIILAILMIKAAKEGYGYLTIIIKVHDGLSTYNVSNASIYNKYYCILKSYSAKKIIKDGLCDHYRKESFIVKIHKEYINICWDSEIESIETEE